MWLNTMPTYSFLKKSLRWQSLPQECMMGRVNLEGDRIQIMIKEEGVRYGCGIVQVL